MFLELGVNGIDFVLDVLGLNIELHISTPFILAVVLVVSGLRVRKVLRDKKRRVK